MLPQPSYGQPNGDRMKYRSHGLPALAARQCGISATTSRSGPGMRNDLSLRRSGIDEVRV